MNEVNTSPAELRKKTRMFKIVGDSLVAREGIFAQSGEHPSVIFQGGRIFERGGG